MQTEILLKGILVGLIASAPLGPISILIIQRTINHNFKVGLCSAAGAAISDTIYATIAGFGVTLILNIVSMHETAFRIFSSVVLLVLGTFVFLSHPEKYNRMNGKKRISYLNYTVTTFLLTASNPLVIFIHLAIFSGFNLVLSLDKIQMSVLVMTGFFIGAMCWWLLLTATINRFRNRFNLKICLWFNRIAGVAIVSVVLVSLLLYLQR